MASNGNNRKVLSASCIKQFESKYDFEYDKKTNLIYTKIIGSKKSTAHSIDKPFSINARMTIGCKVTLNVEAIKIWLDFQASTKFKKYSLFVVNNTVNKLKVMYQTPTRQNVSSMLLNEFDGIRKV